MTQIEWFGQSTFRLTGDGAPTVVIDPYDAAAIGARRRWDYPALDGLTADLLLVTHEHADHNGVGAIGGDPAVVRSLAGTFETPHGTVVGVASEHDDAAGTQRGHNVMYVFDFGGLRVAHLGDLGQAGLRDEQRAALGVVDVLFVPVGGGPTIGAEAAAMVARELGARVVVPMHFRTERIDFLEPVDGFMAASSYGVRLDASSFVVEEMWEAERPVVVVPAAP